MMLITDGVSTTGGTDPTAEALSMAALAKDEGIFIMIIIGHPIMVITVMMIIIIIRIW